jgi:transposase
VFGRRDEDWDRQGIASPLVLQAQIDAGQRDGVTSTESEQIKALKKKNRELKEANEILRQASIFFAGEFDPRRH